jgi:hypothetical protein
MRYRFILADGSSMVPTYSDRIHLLLIDTSKIADINDIIAYTNDGKKVHRVVGKCACDTGDRMYYTVKPDSKIGYYNYVQDEDIDGVVVFGLPIFLVGLII